MNSKSRRIEEQFAKISDDDSGVISSDSGDSRDECSEAAQYVNQLIARMNGGDQNQGEASLLSPDPIHDPLDDPQPELESFCEADRSVAVSEESIVSTQVRKPQRPIVMEADLERLREAANISATGHLNSFETKTAIFIDLFISDPRCQPVFCYRLR